VTFVEIVLHNDRCGDYEDTLVCEMTDSSGTISVDFPVHTRVIGLPLTLYPNITGTSRRKPNQHLLKLEEKMRATGCSQQEINLALGDQRVAQVSDNLDAVIGPIHTRGGGEALDEELKQWAFKSRYRTKTVPDNHSEAEAATWQIRFAGRAEGLEYVQQTMTVMNRGTTDIQLDFALFPHELGVHNLVEAEQTLVQQPAWAAELQKQEEEQQRIADAIEADRLLAIQQKKLDLMKAAAAAAMEAAADAEGGAEPAEGEEGAAEPDDSAAKAKDKAAQALQSAMGAHMFALERKAKVARDAKEAAEKELLSLNRNKLAELKRTKVPTGSVHSILKAVLILLQLAKAKEVKDWKTCRKLACAMDFFPTVMAYDTSATIPAKRLARVQRYLAEAGGEEGAKQGSIVAWVLAKWLTNTLAVYEQEQLKVTAQKEAAAAAAAAAGGGVGGAGGEDAGMGSSGLGSLGRGRGRGSTLPAWATSAQSTPAEIAAASAAAAEGAAAQAAQSAQSAQPAQSAQSGQAIDAGGVSGRGVGGSVGVGRGRGMAMTRPAWMNKGLAAVGVGIVDLELAPTVLYVGGSVGSNGSNQDGAWSDLRRKAEEGARLFAELQLLDPQVEKEDYCAEAGDEREGAGVGGSDDRRADGGGGGGGKGGGGEGGSMGGRVTLVWDLEALREDLRITRKEAQEKERRASEAHAKAQAAQTQAQASASASAFLLSNTQLLAAPPPPAPPPPPPSLAPEPESCRFLLLDLHRAPPGLRESVQQARLERMQALHNAAIEQQQQGDGAAHPPPPVFCQNYDEQIMGPPAAADSR
jgi:hypothetical protein